LSSQPRGNEIPMQQNPMQKKLNADIKNLEQQIKNIYEINSSFEMHLKTQPKGKLTSKQNYKEILQTFYNDMMERGLRGPIHPKQ
jgi:hypothetical protein